MQNCNSSILDSEAKVDGEDTLKPGADWFVTAALCFSNSTNNSVSVSDDGNHIGEL